jgi:hypothetical protein
MVSNPITQLSETADGRKVVSVRFLPQVANPAAQSTVEVVFEVQRCPAPHLDEEPYVLIGPISCTLTDTRELYPLSTEERRLIIEFALQALPETPFNFW